MIVPLYANADSPEWDKLLKLPLNGHLVILNPNDGPKLQHRRDIKAWRKLASELSDKGANILVYLDACRAKRVGNGWELKEKAMVELQQEIEFSRLWAEKPRGFFLDDWTPQGPKHRKVMISLAERLLGGDYMVVANPGTGIKQSEWPDGIEFIEHETEGMPSGSTGNFIALNVHKCPPALASLQWVTNASEDANNPYAKLPDYVSRLSW